MSKHVIGVRLFALFAATAAMPSACSDEDKVSPVGSDMDGSSSGSFSPDAMPDVMPDGLPVAVGCPDQTGPGTQHQGVIRADETWTAATGPHIIASGVTVRQGTLTIEPCVVVKIKQGVHLVIGDGNAGAPPAGLIARGSPDRPILFTSFTSGEFWGEVGVLASATVDLEHVTMKGAADPATATGQGGALVIVGPGGVLPLRNTRIKNVRIEDAAGHGVNVTAAGGFTADSSGLVITGSGQKASPSYDTRYPIYVTPPSVQTLPAGTYTGNAIDQILVGPGVTQNLDEAFHDLGIPYRIKEGFAMAPTKSARDGGLTTLTLDAGVRLLLLKSPTSLWSITLGSSGGSAAESIWPTRLVAMGTAEKPIVLTSAAATPAAGDWGGLYWSGGPGTGNVMSHVRVEYAGGNGGTGNFGCGPGDNDAAIIITSWRPETAFMSNVTISDSAGGGIVSGWTNDADGPNLKPGNTFLRIGNGCDVSRWKNATAPACPSTPPVCF